jgi:phosphotransferase system HPr (HPr) family protein
VDDAKPATITVTISNPNGLHLRVGKEMVYIANRFQAQITAENLTRPSPVVDVKSILQIMQLQARTGHTIRISADGPDAHAALDALRDLLAPAGSPA